MDLNDIEPTFQRLRHLIYTAPDTTWHLFVSYPQPPPEFVTVMKLLISVLYGAEVRDWWDCRPYLSREDLPRRVANMEPENIRPFAIERIKAQLERVDSDVIEQMSHIGHTVYQWLQFLTKYNEILLLSRRVHDEHDQQQQQQQQQQHHHKHQRQRNGDGHYSSGERSETGSDGDDDDDEDDYDDEDDDGYVRRYNEDSDIEFDDD